MSATATIVEVKERPIIFSGPMVRAILEGRKTQTRRVIKGLPEGMKLASPLPESGYRYRFTDFTSHVDLRCPYGRPQLPLEPPQDRLWVRETWLDSGMKAPFPISRSGPLLPRCLYRADYPADWLGHTEYRLKNAMFMPRWASRITLEITNVRVERLWEISAADAKAEGVGPFLNRDSTAWRAGFQLGWDSINAKRGYSWASNPWVWVLEFRQL